MKIFENDERYGGNYEYNGEKSYTVDTMEDAWLVVYDIFPCEFNPDDERSKGAGYPIYYGTKFYNNGVDCWISDLGDRLEVCLPGATVNIWVRPEYIEDKVHGSAIPQTAYDEWLQFCTEMSDDEARKAISEITGFAAERIIVKHITRTRKNSKNTGKHVDEIHARVPLANAGKLVYVVFAVDGKCWHGEFEIIIDRLHKIQDEI